MPGFIHKMFYLYILGSNYFEPAFNNLLVENDIDLFLQEIGILHLKRCFSKFTIFQNNLDHLCFSSSDINLLTHLILATACAVKISGILNPPKL